MTNLTEKEQKVLALTDGRTIEEIAAALSMNPRTVKYHSDNLRFKFGVKSRRDLIRIREKGA